MKYHGQKDDNDEVDRRHHEKRRKCVIGQGADNVAALGEIRDPDVTRDLGLLEERDKLVENGRRDILEGLRQNDVKHRLAASESQ